MKIDMYEIPICQVYKGYEDNSDSEGGVFALDGRLTCRPSYQREFVYKDKQRDEVIQTIRKGFPLNVMYWVRTDKHDENTTESKEEILANGTFELFASEDISA